MKLFQKKNTGETPSVSPKPALNGASASLALAPRKKELISGRAQLNIRRTLVYIVLVILTLMCLFPIWILLVNMTRTHAQIQTNFSLWFGGHLAENWTAVFNRSNIKLGNGLLNSLFIAFFSSILTCYFSALTAFAIQIYNFKGKSIIFTFILLIMMIPSQVGALGFLQMMTDMKALNKFWPLILPSIASPVVFFYMKQYMEAVLPFEIIEAARVDGASEISIFHIIVLPLMVPALAVQFIFCFVGSWNNLFIPSLLLTGDVTKETIPIIISKFTDNSNPINFDLGQVYVAIGLAIIPLVIMYLFFSRFIIKGMTAGAVKG